MVTKAGIPCPDCKGEERTAHVAPFADKNGNRYAVGAACYRKQWRRKYGKDVPCQV